MDEVPALLCFVSETSLNRELSSAIKGYKILFVLG